MTGPPRRRPPSWHRPPTVSRRRSERQAAVREDKEFAGCPGERCGAGSSPSTPEREAPAMNIIHTTHPHEHHHVVPLAIAGATAVVATALLTGPVHLSFGGDDPATSASNHVKHLGVVSAAATVGLCSSSATRQVPSDVPAPACGVVVVH